MSIDCLILNLTRFGDLIQSQSLIHDLHAHGLSTGIVCQENFAPALPLLDCVEESFLLKGASLLKHLDWDWKTAATQLRDWVYTVQEKSKARYVLNLTATLPARLLARLLSPPAQPVLGFGLDEEGFGVNFGPWATFLSGTSACRQNAVFNIADMFRMMAGPLYSLLGQEGGKTAGTQGEKNLAALKKPDGQALQEASKILSEVKRLPQGRDISGFIALQLGASAAKRQWPTEYFARLGDRLWGQCRLCPVLTGTKGEANLATRYAEESVGPYINAIGKTSLPVLSALLTRMRLLVTNDTGTLHLAAALGTPSLSFFLATAQPWDTGPNLAGCLCLEPDLDCHPCAFKTACPNKQICLEIIKPEPVANLLAAKFAGASWTEAAHTANGLAARIWETAKTKEGFATILSRSRHVSDDRTLWIRHQRLFWRQILGRLQNDPFLPTAWEDISPCSPKLATRLTEALTPALHLLAVLREEIPLLDKSPQAGTLFLRNCDRLQTLLATTEELTSLAFFWRELRTDYGHDIGALSEALGFLSAHLTALLSNIKNGTNYA